MLLLRGLFRRIPCFPMWRILWVVYRMRWIIVVGLLLLLSLLGRRMVGVLDAVMLRIMMM